MNTMNENAQAMTLTEAVTTMASTIQELVDLAKAESTTSTTEATTETTTETTTADAEFKGSMINNDPCDPIPAIGEVKNQVFVKELDKIADEANAERERAKTIETARMIAFFLYVGIVLGMDIYCYFKYDKEYNNIREKIRKKLNHYFTYLLNY